MREEDYGQTGQPAREDSMEDSMAKARALAVQQIKDALDCGIFLPRNRILFTPL